MANLYVKTNSVGTITLDEVESSSTGSDIKALLEAQGIKTEGLRLIANGKFIGDDDPISKFNVTGDNTISLT
jgi:hypothetical protein